MGAFDDAPQPPARILQRTQGTRFVKRPEQRGPELLQLMLEDVVDGALAQRIEGCMKRRLAFHLPHLDRKPGLAQGVDLQFEIDSRVLDYDQVEGLR
jgi:hypothetical protein